MKKLIIIMIALVPLTLWAQDNTWEQPEEEQEAEVAEKPAKVNPDQKYLRGAVPVVDGKVVFSTHITAPGKKADEVYTICKNYIEKMLKQSNQINSSIITDDADRHLTTAVFEEWLVFKKTFIAYDRTRFKYALEVISQDGAADIRISHIRYTYDEERDAQHYTAEEWITDKEAVNKKNTKLLPLSGKFRRKTIDRKDFLFNKFQSLLQ